MYHYLGLSVFLLSIFSLTAASPHSVPEDAEIIKVRDLIFQRALPDNPSGKYAPAIVDCPDTRPTIRSATSLSDEETSWLKTRRNNTISPMTDFLNRAFNGSGFDAESYINSVKGNSTALPNVGIAVSGGGYRALMNGAGFLAAADSRVDGSTESGGIGGLLQSATYLAGLSGGGWLVGSIYANNFSTVVQLRDGSPGSDLWAFDRSIFEGPDESGISIINTASYYSDVEDAVASKRDAGFNTSITDYWGRTLSYQLINSTDGGPTYTFSSIARTSGFDGAPYPLPILVADGRAPETTIVSLNSTVYEFNPWELGSFDPTVYGFAPLHYIGSNFSAGSVSTNGSCVNGFDQYGFVMGTSSSLFNEFLLQNLSSYNIPSVLTSAIEDILNDLGSGNDDIAQYQPNPFLDFHPDTNPSAGSQELTLVDGGEDLQNIPLHPLLQPIRGVDVIFAVDSSADTIPYNWPNGTALRATYDRTFQSIANGTNFPAVPDAETFINLGLNRRPTFFGCNTTNFTSDSPIPPLIVYVPNSPYSAYSNVSTYTFSYPKEQRNSIIENGYNVATMGNGTMASDWLSCAGCAVLQRSLEKTGTDVPDVCQKCFDTYCWNGTVDSTPVTSYQPTPVLNESSTSSSSSAAMPLKRGVGLEVLGLMVGIGVVELAM